MPRVSFFNFQDPSHPATVPLPLLHGRTTLSHSPRLQISLLQSRLPGHSSPHTPFSPEKRRFGIAIYRRKWATSISLSFGTRSYVSTKRANTDAQATPRSSAASVFSRRVCAGELVRCCCCTEKRIGGEFFGLTAPSTMMALSLAFKLERIGERAG